VRSADVLLPLGLQLGEGVTAIDETSFLIVDIRTGTVIRADLSGNSEILAQRSHTIGSAVQMIDGRLLIAGPQGVSIVGGSERIDLDGQAPDIRMNDGKVDPVGRFVGGTMAEPVREGAGTLWSFAGGTAVPVVRDVTISNGLCWSADGSKMYYIDTPTYRIDCFDYDVATGMATGRRTEVCVDPGAGDLDGLTIDDEGGLWVALWGGGAVHRYVAGRLCEVVEVPTPFVTSVAFVGGTLIITSAREPTTDSPLAGHVFAVDVGIRGPLPGKPDAFTIFGDERTPTVVLDSHFA
jgi:sugar lactone lactonase YvrE